MGEKVVARGRFWISTYNCWPKKFDNGIVWLRFEVKLRHWHELGGLWFSRDFPFFKPLLPQKGRFRKGHGPIEPLPPLDLESIDRDFTESMWWGDED